MGTRIFVGTPFKDRADKSNVLDSQALSAAIDVMRDEHRRSDVVGFSKKDGVGWFPLSRTDCIGLRNLPAPPDQLPAISQRAVREAITLLHDGKAVVGFKLVGRRVRPLVVEWE